MSPALADALGSLPNLAARHLLLALSALLLGIATGLPLAVWAVRRPWLRASATGLASLVQTVPSLALLALFYPLLLGLGRLTGIAIPALGFLPALLALALYALLPVLRTSVAALTGVAPGVLEAADAVGMTPAQRLRLVELPLAAPVIMAGVRTAATWTIGAATLATTVGQPCLGNLIFAGLQTEDWVAVLVGCAGAAGLALGIDGLLALVEAGLARRRPALAWIGVAGVLLAAAVAAIPFAGSGRATAVVGAKDFSEQYILASLIEDRLRSAGIATSRRDNLGSAVAYRALAGGAIDAYVDYSGTLWANVLGRRDNPPPPVLRARLAAALWRRDRVRVLGPLGFENAYALAMRRTRAAALGIRTLDDLAAHAGSLRLGADLEFLGRPEWRAVRDAYGLHFASTAAYSPTFMYRAVAVADGTADVISAFSSDGRIVADDLVLLADTRHALPSYDALLLVSPARAGDRRFVAALMPLVGSLDVERMRAANLQVDRDRDKRTPEQAAQWLARASAVHKGAAAP